MAGVPRRRGHGELETLVLAALRAAEGPVTAGWMQERLGGDPRRCTSHLSRVPP